MCEDFQKFKFKQYVAQWRLALARPRPGRPAGLGEVVRAEVLLVDLARVEETVQQPVDQLDGGEEHKDEDRVDQPHVPVKCGEVLAKEIVRIK